MRVRTIYDRFSVEGKRALVTGGSSGLGRAMAEALAAGGARVAIVGRSDRVFGTAQEIGAIPLQADLSDRAETTALVPRALDALGGLDVLVSNAGAQRRHPAEDFPIEDWDLRVENALDHRISENLYVLERRPARKDNRKLPFFSTLFCYV